MNCDGFSLSAGNLDDRKPVLDLLHRVVAKVFGDKGYISQLLAEKLLKTLGIELVTCVASPHEKPLNAIG